MISKTNKGISIVEILLVISIIAVVTAVIIPSLSKFRSEQALKNTTEDIISLLNQAKSDSQSSLNSSNYSVHFETGRAVYFAGATFSEPNSSNKQVTFISSVTIPTGGISLNGGGSNVTFPRLTGDTIGYGTITIQLVSDATRQKTITITKTGSVSSN